MFRAFFRRHPKKICAALVLLLIAPISHGAVSIATGMEVPHVELPEGQGRSYARVRAGIREVYLEGSPEQIGAGHARLLHDRMVADERELWASFSQFVPVAAARTFLFDVGRVRYRHVDRGLPEARRRELAAQARAFSPDPFEDKLPTYHRMVFLHALYDIALSFEHSPLIGCSAFGLGPKATANGHTLMARAFDFEAGEVYDRDKAVYFVRGDGVIPFASVAWPGLVGVMSGMNLEGVSVIVNGARAGEPSTEGMPVVFSLREVLERAHDTGEAIAVLREQHVMVSHIVFVADAAGRFAVVERTADGSAFVRDTFADPDRVAVTNHFEGPLAGDPRNERVKGATTTLPRRARADELVLRVGPREATIDSAIAMLRDHTCAGAEKCEIGDRRTIDALIATHGIVADTTDRVLWVSAGPHLSGRFVRFDLRAVFASDHDPAKDPEPRVTDPDPILSDGRYEAGRLRAGGPKIGGDRP